MRAPAFCAALMSSVLATSTMIEGVMIVPVSVAFADAVAFRRLVPVRSAAIAGEAESGVNSNDFFVPCAW